MSGYQLTNDGLVIRIEDGASIPPDLDNRDYAAFLTWKSVGGVPDPYIAPPPAVPQSISDRQFFQQLAALGIITESDALASNAAVIPPPLMTIINAMPAAQQFAAKMIVSGATVFERNNPMTNAIGTAYGWTAAQIDDFFRAAAAL